MSKPTKTHAGFLVANGKTHAITVQQALARYDAWMLDQTRLEIASNEDGISYTQDGDCILLIPHTSEVHEHLKRQLAQGFVHGWYQRNPGSLLTNAMDDQGDALIAEFGMDVFQIVRGQAAEHDVQHLHYLSTRPDRMPPGKPVLRLIKGVHTR